MYKYQIGDKTYIQKALVLGQMLQLSEQLKGLKSFSTSPFEIVKNLGDKLPTALAIVLTLEGESPKGKDLESLAEEISFSIDLETTFKVIEDFFGCNPISLNLKKLTAVMERISEKIPAPKITPSAEAQKAQTGSESSLSFSPGETLPGETKSSGVTPLENANPSPDIS